MSSKGLRSRKDLPLDEIYEEVMDHMKTHGHFDEVRVSLIEPIWSDSYINNIRETFVAECEQFCKQVDLGQNRNTLRAKLATRFDSYSLSRRDLKSHIGRFLQEHNEEIKSKYYKHARAFLQRYLPKPSPEPEETVAENNVETEPKQESPKPEPVPEPEPIPEPEPRKEIEQIPQQEPQPDVDMDMDIESISPKDEDDEEVEKPPYSPIGNSDDDMDIIREPNMTTTPSLDEIPIPPEDENLDNSSLSNPPPLPKEESEIKKENSEPPEEDLSQLDDNDDKDTFSSISTVGTADLSDFDNSIILSDNEAIVVGKPKNSKVPYTEIQDIFEEKKNDLPSTDNESKAEQTETNERKEVPDPMETSESDGGCSEGTTAGKRLARTRKSNPRYSNEHYKLYN